MTLAASGATGTTTTLNAQAYANGAPSTAYFLWGQTTNYGSLSATNTLAANYLAQAVAVGITNLSPSTIYHYQTVVVNGAGTNNGGDLTFATSAQGAAHLSVSGRFWRYGREATSLWLKWAGIKFLVRGGMAAYTPSRMR